MAARLDLNEIEYAPESITSGSYGALDDPKVSVIHFNPLVLGSPSLTSLLLPTVRIDAVTASFLDRHALWPAIDLAENIRSDLRKQMSVELHIVIDQDAEARDREELVVVYSVRNKDYSEILNIWDEISRRVHQALPASLSDRVYVRLVKA